MLNFIGLKEQREALRNKIDSRISKVLDHGNYILGPEVFELEERLSEYIGCKHCVTCSSGTDALLMSLMANQVGPGDAVITSSFTYIATAEVIELLGAKTYFCDISPITFNINTDNLEQVYNQASKDGFSVKGIIAVDIFGLPSRYRLLESFAKDKSIFLIQDMAQSFGSKIKEKKSGTFGNMGATSFFPSKPLGCYGDGGAIFTNDDNLADVLKSIRVHGSGKDKYDNIRIGINGRLDTIQAAVLLEKLNIFDEELNKREEIANYYRDNIKENFQTQLIPKDYSSAHALFPILTNSTSNRDKILEELSNKNIPSMIYYPKSLNKQSIFTELNQDSPSQPISEKIASQIFAVPFHPYLTKTDLDLILDVLNNAKV